MMRIAWIVPVALAVGLGLTAGCGKEEPVEQPPVGQIPGPPGSHLPGPPPGAPGAMPAPGSTSPDKDAALVASGTTVYVNNCSGCHGPTGKTDDANKPDFTNAAWHASRDDAQVKKYIADGVPPQMPAFKDKLKVEEMDALVAALRSFVKPPDAIPAP